ncbi:MAG TPA: polyphosphate kinase 1 [Bacteroidota bacterium]
MKSPPRTKNRDLSWLSFNHRVLQEARDRRVPLYERIKFLAIYSSNADEFFRVRVAATRALLNLKKKTTKKLGFEPARLLKRIRKVVERQQEEFGDTFRNSIKKELKKHHVMLVRDDELNRAQRSWVLKYFQNTVEAHVAPVFLSPDKDPPFLRNRALYLAVRLKRKAISPGEKSDGYQHAIVEIPSQKTSRFVTIPSSKANTFVMFLDDVVRVGLPEIFPNHTLEGAYAIKLTRDAELYIDDEYSGNLVEKVRKALSKRDSGIPARFLFDLEMPKKFLQLLTEIFALGEDDCVIGGRYHNFNDLFTFPNPLAPKLLDPPLKPLMRNGMGPRNRIMEETAKRDLLLHYPYHGYDPVIRFVREAAENPRVTSIRITLYRVARQSGILDALMLALANGKSVTAFIEVKARFDEESNLKWADELEKAGATVLYSFPGWKVHAKLCLVSLKGRNLPRRYAYLSTGNFNEKTATLYADHGFFTSDRMITEEVARVFSILSRGETKLKFKYLLVAPFTMRKKFGKLIDEEIQQAQSGKKASIIAKMNSLEDPWMIAKLYKASEAGVKISLIVRGICCLLPGIKGLSSNIEVISIVDRFLEHSRIYFFHHGGKKLLYLASADWMSRNLSRRIEVAFPIKEPDLHTEIMDILQIQLNDSTKARVINKRQDNSYRTAVGEKVHSQEATYQYLRNRS